MISHNLYGDPAWGSGAQLYSPNRYTLVNWVHVAVGATKPADLKSISDIVYSFGAAYERGILSEKEVLENMIAPLITLLKDLSSGSRDHFDDPAKIQPILAKWVFSLREMFAGVSMEEGDQNLMYYIMSHAKRAALVQALLKTDFVRVS